MTPLNTTLPIEPVELRKTKQLTPTGKEYLRFCFNSNSPHAAQCVKSRILNKSINYILSIDKFEQKDVVIKYMLQWPRLEDNMKTIGMDQSLFKISSFDHKRLNNIKRYINMQVSVTTKKP